MFSLEQVVKLVVVFMLVQIFTSKLKFLTCTKANNRVLGAWQEEEC
jgi:hypothetical protein